MVLDVTYIVLPCNLLKKKNTRKCTRHTGLDPLINNCSGGLSVGKCWLPPTLTYFSGQIPRRALVSLG